MTKHKVRGVWRLGGWSAVIFPCPFLLVSVLDRVRWTKPMVTNDP
jgi:hypothetical protein